LTNLTIYMLVATIMAHLTLGAVVISNNKRSAPNRLIFSLSVIISSWTLAILIVTVQDNYHTVLFWVRVSHALGILIPWHIFALALSLFSDQLFSFRQTKISLFFTIAFSLLAFTPYFIVGIQEPYEGKELVYGILTVPFILFLIIMSSLSIHKLYRKLAESRGLVRIQMYYLIAGTTITALLAVPANVFLPLTGITHIGQVDIRALGPVFSLIMIGAISYAIVKYRFMNIRFALRKNVTITFTAFTLALISVLLVRVLFRWNMVEDPLAAEILVALIVFFVVLGLPALKNRLQYLFDNTLFKRTEDYYSYLTRRARNLQNVLELDKLLDALTGDIVKSMNLEHGFYSLTKSSSGLKVAGFKTNLKDEINVVDPKTVDDFTESLQKIIDYISGQKEIIVRSEIARKKLSEESLLLDYYLEKLQIEVTIPLMVNNSVEGILLLGTKQTGEPFYREDINLFSLISSQVTVTLINAQLYQEIFDIKLYQEKILDNMGNGLLAINQRGKITLFNSEVAKYTGISSEKALGSRAIDILDRDLYRIIEQTLAENKGQVEVETKVQAGSEQFYLSCSTTLVESSEPGNLEVIMVLSNITQVKELEKERSQSQRLISLGEIAAGIAHEIKNPLVSIKTFAELLPHKYDQGEFRHGFSKIVSQEITRITTLVDELLNFVKKTDLNLEAVEMNGLLDEVLLLLSPQLEMNDIDVLRKYQKHLPIIRVDRSMIKQALLNICVNAIHAMPEGGEIAVDSGLSDNHARPQKWTNAACPQELVVSITDNGIGIPDSLGEKVFDPFITNKSGGIGIGLSISHKIITEHGGKITFDSNEKAGTKFTISLPLEAG
jgi:PAS domain S-box-containing protein